MVSNRWCGCLGILFICMRLSFTIHHLPFILLLFCSVVVFGQDHAPAMPAPPIPVEATFGTNRLQFQAVINRPISANGKLSYFNLSTGAVDYNNTPSETEMVVVNNLTYTLWEM